MSLADARTRCEDAHKLLANDVGPGAVNRPLPAIARRVFIVLRGLPRLLHMQRDILKRLQAEQNEISKS